MQSEPEQIALEHLTRSHEAVATAIADPAFVRSICEIASIIAHSLSNGGKVLFAGNGGSAADAQHMAAELVVRMMRDRQAYAAVALTSDGAVMTAAANDLGFESVFARQLRGLGRRGDVFLALSTSGSSKNLLTAVEAASNIGLTTIAFTGMTGTLAGLCDYALRAPASSTPLIQQLHMTAGHAICLLIEAALSNESKGISCCGDA